MKIGASKVEPIRDLNHIKIIKEVCEVGIVAFCLRN